MTLIDKICLPLFALLDILNSIIPSFGLHKRIQYLCILFLSAQRALLLFPQEVQYKFDEKYKAANHITWHWWPGLSEPWLKHCRILLSLITQYPGFTRQTSLWHSSHGRHEKGVPEQTPLEQRSFLVHALPSVHGKVLLFVQANLWLSLQSYPTTKHDSVTLISWITKKLVTFV